MSDQTKVADKANSLVKQVKKLADTDRDELLRRAKAAGPPRIQKVMVNGQLKEIKTYSLRPLLEPEENQA